MTNRARSTIGAYSGTTPHGLCAKIVLKKILKLLKKPRPSHDYTARGPESYKAVWNLKKPPGKRIAILVSPSEAFLEFL